MDIKELKYTPGAYFFGISYESDMRFATRLFGKTRQKFIEAVNQYWNRTP